jgi:F-type H+-transporting ATPase subunit gamma
VASLKDIRRRITSIRSIQQVTKAMKMVAAAKLRRAQQNMLQARPYAKRLADVLTSILPLLDSPEGPSREELLPVLQVRSVQRTLAVVVTSDRGLAGGFNTNILRTAQAAIDELGRDQVEIMAIGRKARDYFTKRNYSVVSSHVNFWSELEFEHAIDFGQEMIERYVDGSVDQVLVFFNQFRNVISQEIRQEQLLPLVIEEGERVETEHLLFEPSMAEVARSLVPRHLNIQVWRYLLESFASEQAARMAAMENATENADELISHFTLELNKARQASITREILDIVGGAEALRQVT